MSIPTSVKIAPGRPIAYSVRIDTAPTKLPEPKRREVRHENIPVVFLVVKHLRMHRSGRQNHDYSSRHECRLYDLSIGAEKRFLDSSGLRSRRSFDARHADGTCSQ